MQPDGLAIACGLASSITHSRDSRPEASECTPVRWWALLQRQSRALRIRPSCDEQHAATFARCAALTGVFTAGKQVHTPLGRLGAGPIGADSAPPPVVRWEHEKAMRTLSLSGRASVCHTAPVFQKRHFSRLHTGNQDGKDVEACVHVACV